MQYPVQISFTFNNCNMFSKQVSQILSNKDGNITSNKGAILHLKIYKLALKLGIINTKYFSFSKYTRTTLTNSSHTMK